MENKCRLIPARDGNKVPVVQTGRGEVRLGSLYDGKYAAERWAGFYVPEGAEYAILYGMGDCQIILQLLAKIPGGILVYEPNEALYKEMQRTAVYKKIQKQKRVRIFGGESMLQAMADAIHAALDEDCAECTLLLSHPGYAALCPEPLEKIKGVCDVVCEAIGFMKGPIQRFILAMIRNQIKNISYMKGGIPLARLAKHWNKEIPVILVSAGPSLERNINFLKQINGRAYLFCADAALPTLLKNGIVPDLVGCMDATKNMNCFNTPESYEIPLLVTTNTPKELIQKSTGTKIWGYDHEFAGMLCKKSGIEPPEKPAYIGISTAMYAAILELGSKKIILAGQDLSYSPDGKSHTSDRNEGFAEDEKYKVEGYYGGVVQSRMDWVNFLHWFEEMIKKYPDREVINATEGGARIHGAVQKSLAEAIAELPENPISFQEMIADERVAITDEEYEKLMAAFAEGRKDLETVRKQGYEKTFYESDYQNMPAMRLVLEYMRCQEEKERKVRFEKAIEYVYNEYVKEMS